MTKEQIISAIEILNSTLVLIGSADKAISILRTKSKYLAKLLKLEHEETNGIDIKATKARFFFDSMAEFSDSIYLDNLLKKMFSDKKEFELRLQLKIVTIEEIAPTANDETHFNIGTTIITDSHFKNPDYGKR